MPAREKKPVVKPEKRQEWLERNERGESPPHIAATDGFDARTVRNHIDKAREGREVKEARSTVLRNALERHYADLCRCAERLGENRRENRNVDLAAMGSAEGNFYEPELAVALRQHIPKSAIWKLLNQEKKLLADMDQLTKEVERKIESKISSDSRLFGKLTGEENGVVPGIVIALKGQLQQWIRRWTSLNVKDNLRSEPAENGFVYLSYGAYGFGMVQNEHVELAGDAITHWTEHFRASENIKKLEQLLLELERVRKQLREEIAVIVLRRVVPGHCRYCPLQ